MTIDDEFAEKFWDAAIDRAKGHMASEAEHSLSEIETLALETGVVMGITAALEELHSRGMLRL